MTISEQTEHTWRDLSECDGTDTRIFFPEALKDYFPDGHNLHGLAQAFEVEAKAICAVCQVRSECLNWALDTGQQFGIWGGTDSAERKRIQVKRRRLRSSHAPSSD